MKIALIENGSKDFYRSRLRYGEFLQKKGHDVIAIIPDAEYYKEIKGEGFPVVSLHIDVRKRNLKTVLSYIHALKKILKKESFDVVHFYRLQPNLLGTPTAYFNSRSSKIINHITGLGVAFSQNSLKFKLYRQITRIGYHLNNSTFKAQLVFQNQEDKEEMGGCDSYAVVKGSAVNEDRFYPEIPVSYPLHKELTVEKKIVEDRRTLLFVSRLVKVKGLEFLLEAVRQYNESSHQKINLLIAGWIDPRNPDSFTDKEVEEFSKIEGVYFLGARDDIPDLMAFSDIAVLPTFYGEGTPRFLLEAMASGKPIITTDNPGCNHLVPENKNGKLIQPKSVTEIVTALRWLEDKDLKELGRKGYQLYKEEFSEKVVYNQLLKLYGKRK